jgi:hypothetical protein
MNEEKFTQGFNSGYLLEKNDPEKFKLMLNGTNGESDYLEGLKEGRKEYLMEQYQQRMKDHADKKAQDKDKEPDRGR